jgi:hypothetical protein
LFHIVNDIAGVKAECVNRESLRAGWLSRVQTRAALRRDVRTAAGTSITTKRSAAKR